MTRACLLALCLHATTPVAASAEPPSCPVLETLDVPDARAWLDAHGQPLTPYTRAFVLLLAHVAEAHDEPLPRLSGARSVDAQAKAMQKNWRRVFTRSGPDDALAWTLDIYADDFARRMHATLLAVESGDASFSAWRRQLARHVARGGPSHTNGRALDVTPRSRAVATLLRETLAWGARCELFAPHGKGLVKERDHYHVQLDPPTQASP